MNFTIFYHDGANNQKRAYKNIKSAQSFCRRNNISGIIRNIDPHAGRWNMFERHYQNGKQIGSNWNQTSNAFPY